MYLSRIYPWQLISRAFNLDMACKLRVVFDSEKLQNEVTAIFKEYAPKKQHGPYHDGGWTAIGLIAADGDYLEDRALKDIDDKDVRVGYQKTKSLLLAPYLNSVIDYFSVSKERVRLLNLGPGKRIYWHYDGDFVFPDERVRLHIPIFTNNQVKLQIGHQNLFWAPGEVWFGDFSFPHRVSNDGTMDRVHLVLDLKFEDQIQSLFPSSMTERPRARKAAQYLCRRSYTLCTPKALAKRLSGRFSRMSVKVPVNKA